MSNKKLKALPHQVAGTQFLRERSAAALFDEQGLGKSKQLIDAMVQDLADEGVSAALIVCPNGLKTTWAEEIEKHSEVRYAVFGSGKKARREAFRSLRARFYVINYEAIASELTALKAMLKFRPTALVLDESHRIKSPGAVVTRAVHELKDLAAKRIIMSGTPVANKPDDLWSQVFFLDNGAALGTSFAAFRKKYCSNGGYVQLEDLRERLGGISLRREKQGTVKLPGKVVSRVAVKLAGEQLRLYQTLRNELSVWVRSLSGEQVEAEAENILARLVRLAQLASNPRLLDAGYSETPAKIAALDEALDLYIGTKKERVIVWTSFVDNIRELMRRYRRFRPVCLHGEMDGKSRDRAVRLFKEEGGAQLLIANPAAAREGLTLTQSRVAIYVDRTFSLVDFLQSQDRIHRLSQTRDCEIVLLVAERTIDEFIDFALAQKHRLARYTQRDSESLNAADRALLKPSMLKALVNPDP